MQTEARKTQINPKMDPYARRQDRQLKSKLKRHNRQSTEESRVQIPEQIIRFVLGSIVRSS